MCWDIIRSFFQGGEQGDFLPAALSPMLRVVDSLRSTRETFTSRIILGVVPKVLPAVPQELGKEGRFGLVEQEKPEAVLPQGGGGVYLC